MIEYTPNLTQVQKEIIRQNYLGIINCIGYNAYPNDPNKEIWNVFGYYNARPKAERPDDPDVIGFTAL